MQLAIGNMVSVILGGLLVFAAQWFVSRQNAKVEERKWRKEELREIRRDIARFREGRARPVFEALDKVAHRWDIDSIIELADSVGYEGEPVDKKSEEYEQRKREQKREYFELMKKDISSASVIHDPDLRNMLMQLMWQSTQPDAMPDESTPTLQDAYLKLEKWIFNPKFQQNSVQHLQ